MAAYGSYLFCLWGMGAGQNDKTNFNCTQYPVIKCLDQSHYLGKCFFKELAIANMPLYGSYFSSALQVWEVR